MYISRVHGELPKGVPHFGHLSELMRPKALLQDLQIALAVTGLASGFGTISVLHLGHLGAAPDGPMRMSILVPQAGHLNPN